MAENKDKIEVGEEFKFVWLDMDTGEFSNSWTNNENKYLTIDLLDRAAENNCVVIKYQCINDSKFEFYNMMKLR